MWFIGTEQHISMDLETFNLALCSLNMEFNNAYPLSILIEPGCSDSFLYLVPQHAIVNLKKLAYVDNYI